MVKKKCSITLSQACEGMILEKQASGKSPHTISDYQNTFKKIKLYFESDPPIDTITKADMVSFFGWLQKDYVSEPDGVAYRGKIKLSQKSVLNIHTNLSSLWHWAVDEKLVRSNIVREIKMTKPSDPVIIPFTNEEFGKLVKACEASRSWKTRQETQTHRPTMDRDIAILFTLFDTGARASELCNIQYRDLNLATKSIVLRGKGPGREPKERNIPVGSVATKVINKMLYPRLSTIQPDSPLFVVRNKYELEMPYTRDNLGNLLERIGERAGVPDVHPHRFRHSFSINFLRNGGNVFALQKMLGHTSLDMVKRYLLIAETDLEREQQKASPVDNWYRSRK